MRFRDTRVQVHGEGNRVVGFGSMFGSCETRVESGEIHGDLLAGELGSPKAIERMTSWLYCEKPKTMELIVDEMLAICAEIETWRKKAEGREAQAAYSRWLNSETRRRSIESTRD